MRRSGVGLAMVRVGGQVDYHCPIGAGRGSRLPLGTRGTSLILTGELVTKPNTGSDSWLHCGHCVRLL